eukprot:7071247-Heterocapsa_arctica.AAC.2
MNARRTAAEMPSSRTVALSPPNAHKIRSRASTTNLPSKPAVALPAANSSTGLTRRGKSRMNSSSTRRTTAPAAPRFATRSTEHAGHRMPPMACSFSPSRRLRSVGAAILPSALGISTRIRPS